ncbi:MAG: hypothetical protein ACRECJ_00845 [Limisphaerales bacterium]
MKKRPSAVLISAIIGITVLEGLALYKGLDGKFFGLALASIAGIGGFSLSKLIFYRQGGRTQRAEGES